MRIAGLAMVLGGWALAVAGLFLSSSNLVRAVIACAGIAISVYGNLGVLNSYYLARANWKR